MSGLRRQIQFVHAGIESLFDGTHQANVELWRTGVTTSGERYVGKAQALDPVRAAALATLAALQRAHPHATQSFELVGVESLEAFDAPFVSVAMSALWQGKLRLLTGFCRVVAFEQGAATARAVLDATNRLLGGR